MNEERLARAQAGDGKAFEELIGPYRRELHVHCYRMLGSVQDAEDVLQEALLAAWQSLERFDGRSLRAWLYRIATNRCLNYLRDTSRRPQGTGADFTSQFLGASPSDEPWWLEPYPDALIDNVTPGPEARYETRESIALSFVAGLQHLPTQQRSALVLRDVLGFSPSETAHILDSTAASVNSALQRARAGFRPTKDPERTTLPRSDVEAQVVDRFVEAFQRGDLDAVVALLTEDSVFSMPPEPVEFRGPRTIGEFLRSLGFWGKALKLVPTGANNQPAFGYYLPDRGSGVHRASGMLVLTVAREGVSAITRFGDRGVLARFGLPRALPSD